MARIYLLVHGFWLGSWAWDDVRSLLEAGGATVIAPTLPGNDPGSDRHGIGLEDHVRFVTDIVDDTEGDVVLVGHSAGGAVVHAVVDRRPDRIEHVIYVDTRPLPDGLPLNLDLPYVDADVPRRPWADFAPGWLDGLDEAAIARFERLGSSSPAGAARDQQRLRDVRRYDVPVTFIATTQTGQRMRERAAEGEPLYSELPRFVSATYVDLPTGHYPMLSRPAELAAAITDAVDE